MSELKTMLSKCLAQLPRDESEAWHTLEAGHMVIGRVIGHTIGLEVELDPTQGAFVLALRLTPEGQLPDGYYVDSQERTVRRHIAAIPQRLCPELAAPSAAVNAVLQRWETQPGAAWWTELCAAISDTWSVLRDCEADQVFDPS